jgi:hypothetical protein
MPPGCNVPLNQRGGNSAHPTTTMQAPVKDRVAKLREEITEIAQANREYAELTTRSWEAVGDHARRLQRLEEIKDELKALTNWRKT